MSFESLSAFFNMDGHGVYIWAAYGSTLIILAANLWWPMLTRRSIIRTAKSAILKGMNSQRREDQS
ncbi:MAG: heme exporter protein CcmD [Gammaproteobacteria bacterium]|nr:heme exporter protein CcmD [Gammaproteobacteria bacterium]MBT7879251.1 heme exporter protein CcmD [Gammaproteobacteria bacterium]